MHADVDRALADDAPSREDLAELEAVLRGHIEALYPAAEAAVEELWHGSVEWYERRSALDRIRNHATAGLGDTYLTAYVQVRSLARYCQALLTYGGREQ